MKKENYEWKKNCPQCGKLEKYDNFVTNVCFKCYDEYHYKEPLSSYEFLECTSLSEENELLLPREVIDRIFKDQEAQYSQRNLIIY